MVPISEKMEWEGRLCSVQPRIRLLRSFDQRSHSYLGYILHVRGTMAGKEAEFHVAIGKAAHAKSQYRVGDLVMGNTH